MKILAIRGRNLASLEGGFELDFTIDPLLSAGIFAISGPTGAGKSTILDAMCLALFGKTPRTEQARENNVRVKDMKDDALMQSDPRFLLRRGTASGYAEVDFFAMNGFRYRSRWSVMRAREKENGRLQQPRFSLFNLDKREEEQGTRSDIQNRIVDLIGLSFDQFTRSVLLAQNDFATFLKAEQGEKASLLEKLTGTEMYSQISRIIFQRNSEAKEAYEKVLRLIQGIELIPEEEKEYIDLVKTMHTSLQKLEKKKEERQGLQDLLKSTEELIRTKQQQQQETMEKLRVSTSLLENARQQYEVCYKEKQQKEKEYKELQPVFQTARILDSRIESETGQVQETESGWKETLAKKQQSEKEVTEKTSQLQLCTNELEKLRHWFTQYKEKEKIAEKIEILLLHLDAATNIYNELKQQEENIKELQFNRENLESRIRQQEQMVKQQQVLLNQAMKDIQQVDEQLKSFDLSQIDRDIQKKRTERDQLFIQQARMVAKGDVKTIRENLRKGEPCPVCGSEEHPYVTEEAYRQIDTLTKSIAEITLLLESMEKSKERHAALQGSRSQLQEKQFRLQQELNNTQTSLAQLQHTLKSVCGEKDNLEKAYVRQKETLEEKMSAVDQLFGHERWRGNWQNDTIRFRQTLAGFSREWQSNKERLRTMENQWVNLQSNQASANQLFLLHTQYEEEARKSYIVKKEQLEQKREERKKLLQGKPVEFVDHSYQQALQGLTVRLEELQKTQTGQTLNQEQLKGSMEQINRDITQATERAGQHQARLTEWIRQYELESEGIILEDAIEDLNRKRTDYNFRLRTQADNKNKILAWEKELKEKQRVSEQWGKLNELAGSADGAKFRRIAQAYTLDILLNYANAQLKNLTSRYALERVPGTLALQVIDRDMCDEIRTVHSLSGGESFLVSLALALGLSSLSSNRMKVESLFIDEGFGSLDSDTLRIALDALESLRTQGRKIGVISHVQDMTERIPVQVVVARGNNGRSNIDIKN